MHHCWLRLNFTQMLYWTTSSGVVMMSMTILFCAEVSLLCGFYCSISIYIYLSTECGQKKMRNWYWWDRSFQVFVKIKSCAIYQQDCCLWKVFQILLSLLFFGVVNIKNKKNTVVHGKTYPWALIVDQPTPQSIDPAGRVFVFFSFFSHWVHCI